MTLDPNQLLVLEILEELPRETSMHLHGWLEQEIQGMDRAVLAKSTTGHKRVLAIRGGRLLVLIPHAEGIDTADWGEVRGLSVTTHRKATQGGMLDMRYTLAHPLIQALNLEIDLTYLDDGARNGLLNDLEPFTKSALG